MSLYNNVCKNLDLCKDGNCIGCKNKEVWCTDPRCYPHCYNDLCVKKSEVKTNLNYLIIFIALLLFIILIALIIIYINNNFVTWITIK